MIGLGSTLFLGKQGFEGKESVQQEECGDQTAGKTVICQRSDKEIGPGQGKNQAHHKVTEEAENLFARLVIEIFTLMFELPTPAQNIIIMAKPGEQTPIF